MVDVRVREHHRRDGPGVERELLVALERLPPLALVEAAVEQHGGVLGAQEVHRSGDGLGCAEELDLHAASLHQTPPAGARSSGYLVGQGVPSASGAGVTAVPVWRKVEKKQPYWYLTVSS